MVPGKYLETQLKIILADVRLLALVESIPAQVLASVREIGLVTRKSHVTQVLLEVLGC
jgi:hypothetical protein